MDVLYGFLIGLAFPPSLIIVVAAMIAVRTKFGIIAGVLSLLMLAGPVIWIMIFVGLGVGAGFAAIGGWVLGLGIAAIIAILLLISRFRPAGSRPPLTVRN